MDANRIFSPPRHFFNENRKFQPKTMEKQREIVRLLDNLPSNLQKQSFFVYPLPF